MASLSNLHTTQCSISGAHLPLDAMFEVLLRLPAKELCHLRAVCRWWRSLTMDPFFIKVHASRHMDPLFVVTFCDGKEKWSNDDIHMVSIVDLSGSVLKRIRISNAQINVLPACLNLVCTRVVGDGIWVLDPATEDCAPLPSWQYDCVVETYAFGQVASTGQYKGLRIIHLGLNFIDPSKHLCKVITLDESNHRRWKRKQCSPVIVHPEKLFRRGGFMKNVVFNGIVFMMILAVLEPAGVVPFNLETEEWMSTIPGPELLRSLVGVELEHPYVTVVELNCNLSLANLNSCLVTVHNFRGISIDLWFLMDCKRGLWVKNYSISVQLQHDDLYLNEAYPLLVLDDGRIVLYMPEMGC